MINSTVKDSFTVAKGWRKRGAGRIKLMNTTQTQVRSTEEALSVFDTLKLALEALETIDGWLLARYPCGLMPKEQEVITAIKEALAQSEQEYKRGYADAMNWKVQNHLEHLPAAQPEQRSVSEHLEPVAWGVIASNTGKMCQVELDYDEVSDINSKWLVPLYTTPPQRPSRSDIKPLTDEFILNEVLALGTAEFTTICGPREILRFARAIEAAHGIRPTDFKE